MNSIKIDWERIKLLPVIAQDFKSGEVLMLAYMNEEAYNLTLDTKLAYYFSRSKQRIWQKGETSGNIQSVKEIFLDCDNDTLLLKVEQTGVACHTGSKSCFFKNILLPESSQTKTPKAPKYNIIDKLYHTIQERKEADETISYIAKLFKKGDNTFLKKVIEEAGEFTFAVKDKDEKEIIYEGADLIFHFLVALASKNIHPERIEQELARRSGTSGIEEKKNRNN
ncbi:MAG: bifunctional phosphoribosyl-AMP cyclohydrolase/phosphoribosyl-ATP diphosphatase HisIE [Campylobacteraceae bacterium]|jgi:phosphoribosyl-ATP pyrophosphohydrolase/phosphoribosyl-AMP cyclohydrolase|nr:bifunctional phosphoribosyl-AMP cyclohydrolase/phosphoribosyl-ATP diphosphatase HisIE [Campylobacteraceae bacterium]